MVTAPAVGQQQSSAAESSAKWGASIDLEGKLGTDRHLGEADLLLPVFQDADTLLFANVKARLDDNDSKEGNFGLGLRHMHASGWNGGVYGYFDRRRSENDLLFNQLTFGAEALGEDFDFRVNSYWPIGRRVRFVDSLNTATMSGASITFRGGEERALQGFDAEAGWRVPVFEAGGPLDLRLYAGAYSFDDDTVDAVKGPRLRAEFTAYEVPELWDGARITLGAEWQHDEPRGSQGFLSARLRIPLQPERERSRTLTAQERRMTAPIQRDVDIVSRAGTYGAPETATQTAGGGAIAVVDSAASDGAALQTALTNAGADSTVILTGTFTLTNIRTTLQSGQTVIGDGTVQVRSPSGRVASLPVSTGATMTATSNGDCVFLMGNDSTLRGLTLNVTASGTETYAVRIDGATNARVIDNVINASDGAMNHIVRPLEILNGATGAVISGNTIVATTGAGGQASGIWAMFGPSSATITNNSVTARGGSSTTLRALFLNSTTVTVGGNTLTVDGTGVGGTRYIVNFFGGGVTVNPGSTGNARSGGTCSGAAASGAIGFTDGTTCP
jgi:hypothetical protein